MIPICSANSCARRGHWEQRSPKHLPTQIRPKSGSAVTHWWLLQSKVPRECKQTPWKRTLQSLSPKELGWQCLPRGLGGRRMPLGGVCWPQWAPGQMGWQGQGCAGPLRVLLQAVPHFADAWRGHSSKELLKVGELFMAGFWWHSQLDFAGSKDAGKSCEVQVEISYFRNARLADWAADKIPALCSGTQ